MKLQIRLIRLQKMYTGVISSRTVHIIMKPAVSMPMSTMIVIIAAPIDWAMKTVLYMNKMSILTGPSQNCVPNGNR